VWLWPALAQAGELPRRDDAVRTVSYTTEASHSKLKWIPYRRAQSAADDRVVQTAGTAPIVDGSSGVRSLVQLAPEGSSKSELRTDAPRGLTPVEAPPLKLAEPLNDKALQKPAVGPLPGSLLPPPRTEEVLPRLRSRNDGPMIPPLAAKPIEETCPTPEQLNLKPIRQITNDIAPKGDKFPFECPLKREEYSPRSWPMLTYTWKASGLCHKPLYFEDAQLERYGHSLPPYLQSVASAAHFFLVVPALPYFMGVETPNECIYTLGYYRPGSCAPYLLDPFPISVRGALFEAAAWTGAVFVIP
jgi:hypothetical protein